MPNRDPKHLPPASPTDLPNTLKIGPIIGQKIGPIIGQIVANNWSQPLANYCQLLAEISQLLPIIGSKCGQ